MSWCIQEIAPNNKTKHGDDTSDGASDNASDNSPDSEFSDYPSSSDDDNDEEEEGEKTSGGSGEIKSTSSPSGSSSSSSSSSSGFLNQTRFFATKAKGEDACGPNEFFRVKGHLRAISTYVMNANGDRATKMSSLEKQKKRAAERATATASKASSSSSSRVDNTSEEDSHAEASDKRKRGKINGGTGQKSSDGAKPKDLKNVRLLRC